jgi:dihydrofolate reductase
MTRPRRIEGYAIVSEDGMLANAAGIMPEALKFDADQRFFAQGLDGFEAVAHGRHSHEQQPHSHLRRRLILTRHVPGILADPSNEKALFWNPAGASFEQAWAALRVPTGSLAVIGGTEVFGMFLPDYDVFHLTRAPGIRLPGGRPVFPQVPARTPEEVLASHGLVPSPPQMLDAAMNLAVVSWQRQAASIDLAEPNRKAGQRRRGERVLRAALRYG